jgi:DNA-binding GntR family transcriptional regulator
MHMGIKEKICKEIRNRVVLGQLNPGERLIETELSRKFGVSRGPIREALTQLSKEGFVTLIPNKGAVVAKISAQDLKDFYSLLAVLESKAVEWAVPTLNTADIDELVAINESLKRTISGDEEERLRSWSQQNLAFHRFFWKKCGNEKLSWLVEEIRQRIFRYRYTSLMVTSFEDYLQDHGAIIETVRRKEPAKAGRAMEEHILRALRVLMEFFSHVPNF